MIVSHSVPRGSSDPLEKLKDKPQLMQVLSTVDERKDGRLSRTDFKTGLRMAGVTLSDAEFDKVVERADDGSGAIQYREFLESLKGYVAQMLAVCLV